MWLRSSVIALTLVGSSLAYAGEADFHRKVGEWVVAGGPSSGGCAAWRTEFRGTKLTIALGPQDEDLRFTLSNPAWKSLTDGALNVRATYLDSAGEITDLWDMASHGRSADSGEPRIYLAIMHFATPTDATPLAA